MSACVTFGLSGKLGLAAALRQADCLSAQGGEGMFNRLFGLGGALGSVMTIALTLYVAWLAIGLLTGRSALKLSSLTPRMLGLGFTLALATSWIAYKTVVWDLLTGAPDEIAAAMLGTQGSSTEQFATRLDSMFIAISDAAQAATSGTPAASQGMFTPANMLWTAALLMLFGSLGVLLVARIALTALLSLGPIFILMGLFSGTRGLLDGWIKAAVMFSITQLLSVLIGGEALVVMTPIVRGIAASGTGLQMRDGLMMLLASGVFVTLMAVALKAAAAVVSGWCPTASGIAASDPAIPSWDGGAKSSGILGAPNLTGSGSVALAGSDQARISSMVAVHRESRSQHASVQLPEIANGRASAQPLIALPHQPTTAHNRRSGDRLRATNMPGFLSRSATERTLFR